MLMTQSDDKTCQKSDETKLWHKLMTKMMAQMITEIIQNKDTKWLK